MTTTTSYGTWINATGGTGGMNPEQLVETYLGEFAGARWLAELERAVERMKTLKCPACSAAFYGLTDVQCRPICGTCGSLMATTRKQGDQ